METLFWSSFGIIDLEQLNIVETHGPTKWTGRTILGCYCCCSVIVLLNMLIAMMSNSYQDIFNQADVEWKFARSKLWIEYFDNTATLPPPFNMIPSPKSILYCLQWCLESISQSHHTAGNNSRSTRNQKILKTINKRENNYRFVMRNLVKRYITELRRCKQQTAGVTEEDITEIRQDISAFRYELLGILRNAGYNTSNVDFSPKGIYRRKKRSLITERQLLSGLTEYMSIPMSETLRNGTSDDEETDDLHEAVRKERRYIPVPTPAAKFASRLKKVLPYGKASDAVIKSRFVRKAPINSPSISRSLEIHFSDLIDVCSLPLEVTPTRVERSIVESHDSQSGEDDVDLNLSVDNDEDDMINDEREDITQNSAKSVTESNKTNRNLVHFSKKSCHYQTETVFLEMDYQEDKSYKL